MEPVDINSLKPVPQHFVETARRIPNKIAYRDYLDGKWQSYTWSHYSQEVEQAARALIALGVKKGQVVCILGGNRPEWTIAAQAALAIGAVPAGIYFTCSAEEIAYIVNHSECPVILAETNEHLGRIDKGLPKRKKLKHVIAMRRTVPEKEQALTWDEFTALGDEKYQKEVDKRRNAIKLSDTAVLIYTSGTLGPPKAVMISHRSASWVPHTLITMFSMSGDERLISYLPLAHIAECANSILCHAIIGSEIWFCLDTLTMADRLPDCKPTIFFGVPRVWQKIQEKITQRLATATGVKAKLANWAIGVGRKVAVKELNGEPVSGGLRFKHRIADKVILSKVREALGMQHCHFAISGAAPISVDTLEFIAGLGITIYELYGQSEDCGPTTTNLKGALKLGTVGKPIPGLELKIADDDEILVRAPSVFDGYMKDPETTNSTLIDGWMRTGDLGRLDNEGYLTIIGRKKDIMITAGGKNLAPANLENDMMDIPLVEHALLIGEGKKFLSALITISEDVLEGFANEHNLDNASPSHRLVRENIQKEIDQMNTKYSRVEHVREFVILDRPLSQEEGELTPTMKMKRQRIMDNHQDAIEAVYNGA